MSESSGIGTLVKDPVAGNNGDSSHVLVATSELAIAKQVSNEQLIDEERELHKVETAVEGNTSAFGEAYGSFKSRVS